MLKYELMEENLKYAAYKYYPENQDKFGVVVVDKTTKDIVRMDTAPNDEFKWYAMRLYKRVKEWIEKGSLPQAGKIVWY